MNDVVLHRAGRSLVAFTKQCVIYEQTPQDTLYVFIVFSTWASKKPNNSFLEPSVIVILSLIFWDDCLNGVYGFCQLVTGLCLLASL